MRQIDDKIKFENRSEIRSVLIALEEWKEEHGHGCDNIEVTRDIQELIRFLDDMEMCW